MAEIIGEGFKKIAWHRPTHRRFKFQISSGRSYLSWFEPESDTFFGEMMIDEVKTHPSFNKLTFKGVDKNGKREFMVTFTGLDYQTIQKYIQKMKNTNVNVSQAGGRKTRKRKLRKRKSGRKTGKKSKRKSGTRRNKKHRNKKHKTRRH